MAVAVDVRYSTRDIKTKILALFINDRATVEHELAIHLLASHRVALPENARKIAAQLCERIAAAKQHVMFGRFYGLDSNDPQCNVRIEFAGGDLTDLLGGINEIGNAYLQSDIRGARRPDAVTRLGFEPEK